MKRKLDRRAPEPHDAMAHAKTVAEGNPALMRAGMQAACLLKSLHDPRKEILEAMAREWEPNP